MPLENLPDVKDTKKLLNKLTPDAPLPFAFAVGAEKIPSILLLHLTKAGKAQFELIKKETGLKEGTFGSARIVDEVLYLDCEKRLAGVRKDVRGYIKANTPMPVKDVRIFVEGVEVVEREEGGSDLPVKPTSNPEGGSPEGKPEMDPEQLKRFVEAFGRFKVQALEVKKNSPQRFPEFVGYLNDLGTAIKSRNFKDCETAMQKAVNFADDALKVDAPSSTGSVSELEKATLVERLKELSTAYKKALPGLDKGEAESIGKEIRELISTSAPGGKVANLTSANYEKALGQVDRLVLRLQQVLARPTDKKDSEQGGQDFTKTYNNLLPRETALGPYARAGIEAQGTKAKRLADGGNLSAAFKEAEVWGGQIDTAEKRVIQLAGQVDARVQQLGLYVGEGIRKLAVEVKKELQGAVTLKGSNALYALDIQLRSAEQAKVRQASLAGKLKTIAPTPESLKWSPNELKNLDKATDKGGLKGHGSEFSAVLKQLNAVNSDPSPKNLDALEKAARAYIAEADKQYDKLSDEKKQLKDQDLKSDLKYKTSEDMLRLVDRHRSIAVAKEQLPKVAPLPWSKQQEEQAVGLEAKLLSLSGGVKQLSQDDGAGASQSFFIKDGSGKNAFLAKPAKGENVPSSDWKPGGGSMREAMLSLVNDSIRDSIGLDFGVAQTSLTVLDGNGMGGSGGLASVQRVVPCNKKFALHVGEQVQKGTVPVAEMQKILLMDLVTLNLDRQPENILVNEDPQTGKSTCTPIDAGFALPNRKAFRQFKGGLAGSAIFSVAKLEDTKLDPSLVEALNKLDPDELARQMREGKQRLESLSPEAKGLLEDESIEMSRRSTLFLKAAASEFTGGEIAYAYTNFFEGILDAKPSEVGRAIQDALVQLRRHNQAKHRLFAKYKDIGPIEDAAKFLGWEHLPGGITSDFERLEKILVAQKVNPVKQKEIDELLKRLGGIKAVPPPKGQSYDSLSVASKLSHLNECVYGSHVKDPVTREAMKNAGAPEARLKTVQQTLMISQGKMWEDIQAKGKDVLSNHVKANPGMVFEQRAFELAGGEKRLADYAREFVPVPKPSNWPKEDPQRTIAMCNYYGSAWEGIKQFDEYQALGGRAMLEKLGIMAGNQTSIHKVIEQMRILLEKE